LQIAQATILASLRKAFEAIGEPIEALAPMKREPIIIDLDLQRTSKKAVAKWGFRWDGSAASNLRLVLAGITEDTPVDKYNLKCRTKLEDEKILLEGDELISCNGEEEFTEMQKVMDDSKKISLRFRRMPQTEAAIKADKQKRSKKQKYVDPDEAEAEEARSLRRREFEAEGARVFAKLPVPLQEAFGPEDSCKIDNADIALDSCVRMFSRVEAIEDDFMRRTICDECQRLAKAKAKEDNKREALPSKTFSSRKLWLWPAGLPNLLTVQLKRFRNYGGKMEKSSARVKLPPVLDLSQHMLTKDMVARLRPHLAEDARLPEVAETSSGCLYELYGICEHIGSMGGGHYVAYVNAGPSLAEENWYYISDACRDKSTLEKVLNAQAYIAFYRRV
jgi:hypothetical protein